MDPQTTDMVEKADLLNTQLHTQSKCTVASLLIHEWLKICIMY